MEIDHRWAVNLSVVSPLGENTAWCDYSVLDSLARKIDLPSPYRNPDKTLSSLIVFMGEHYVED